MINDEEFADRAEIIREKGTNRSQFFRGAVDKYSWVDVGSSYLPSELQAAYLWGQLEYVDRIISDRLSAWHAYSEALRPLAERACIQLPTIPAECDHNAHMFYVKVKDLNERGELITYLKEHDIQAAFHYVPLHSAVAGRDHGRFHGEDRYTTAESERLLRLPLYFGMSELAIQRVTDEVSNFYGV